MTSAGRSPSVVPRGSRSPRPPPSSQSPSPSWSSSGPAGPSSIISPNPRVSCPSLSSSAVSVSVMTRSAARSRACESSSSLHASLKKTGNSAACESRVHGVDAGVSIAYILFGSCGTPASLARSRRLRSAARPPSTSSASTSSALLFGQNTGADATTSLLVSSPSPSSSATVANVHGWVSNVCCVCAWPGSSVLYRTSSPQ